MNTWIRDFASWSEFCDFAARTPGGISTDTDNPDWYGSASLADALRLAREGWPEGAERIDEITAHVGDLVSPRAYRQEIGFSVVGPGTVDMGRYILGHPECMMTWQQTTDEVQANRGFLLIVLNLSASGGISADTLVVRGAAICALVDALEAEGYRCEVDAYDCAVEGRYSTEIRFPIKRANDPLEPEALAMALAHPSTLRRLVFAAMEMAPTAHRRALKIRPYGSSYGMPADTPRDRGDIHIGRALSTEPQWQSPHAAAAWVRRQLRAQGIEVSDPC